MTTTMIRGLRGIVLGMSLTLGAPSFLFASNSDIPALQGMDLVGEARLKVLFWNIYDAQLYAPEGRWTEDASFALSLTYLRDLYGEKIAERSIQEMRKQGLNDEPTLKRWYEMLANIIPDVSDQNEIVGFADAESNTRFYLDGKLIGEIREPEFTRAFFNIWLGENTSEPKLRDQLLGGQS